MKHITLGALFLGAFSISPVLRATTAVHLSDFGGIEEPEVIWHVSSKSFTSDNGFQNITEVSPGTFQMLLNWSTSQWTGDRTTTNNDRGRAEVKTIGPHQRTHDTYIYTTTWRTNPQFKGSGRFCHITQLKSVDGVEKESGAPMITTSIGSGTSSAVVQYCSTNFSPANVFSPKPVRSITWHPATWLAEQIKVTTTADGEKTGQVVVSLNGDAFQGVTKVEVSRPQSTEYYPKWGLYRKQETSSGFSPSDYIQHSNVSASNVNGGPSQASASVFSPAAGTYASAQSVTITSATGGASIRYTTDGSTPSETAGTIYSGPVSIGSTTTLNAIAYETGFIDSNVTSGTYTITVVNPPAAAPVFSPAAGTYSTAQNVTITSATGGASIRYTTDGSTPSETAGTLYSGPVSISDTTHPTTLEAIAYASGFADSTVTSGTYTITTGGNPVPVTLEAENLSPVGTGATVSTSNDANAGGGVVEFLNSTAAGQSMTLSTPSIVAGTYQFQLRYKPNTSRGQLTVKIDGAQVGGTVDEYATSQTYVTATLGNVTIGSGAHTIVLTVTGKNSASSAFLITADTFTFTPVTSGPPPTVSFEAESLSPVGTGATISTSNDTNASGGVVEFLNSTAAGQSMTLTTPSIVAGTYQFQLRYKPNTSRGQLTVKIDGAQVGGTVDEYATSQTYVTATLGNTTLATGTHTVVLTVTGKNSASSAFLITADKLTFVGQ